MDESFKITELVIIVVAQYHNPSILNPDFLKYNKIVPESWKLTQDPLCTQAIANVQFKNGVSITTDPNRIQFSEVIKSFSPETTKVPKLAQKYLMKLPHVDYRQIGINAKGHIDLGENQEVVQKLINKIFLKKGPWLEFCKGLLRTSLNFSYQLDRGILNLSVENRARKDENSINIPVILFSSNFHRDLQGATPKERLSDLKELIHNWESDINKLKDIVKMIPLGQEIS